MSEEELMMKPEIGTIQREAMPEEEEELQMKPMLQFQPATSLERDGLIKGKSEAPDDRIGASGVQHENNTGMPDRLKAGIENLSGMSMDDVKVHYNSSKPAQLQALAYTQGTDIHVGPGQERHLPHEAWHVVQQKQGTVKPTVQMQGTAINDDAGLEHEADVMGARANNFAGGRHSSTPKAEGSLTSGSSADSPVQMVLGTIGLGFAAAAALWAGKILYDANTHPEISETQDLLKKINEKSSHEDLTKLSTKFFSGKLKTLGPIYFRWNNVVKQLKPLVEDYILSSEFPTTLTNEQVKMLEIVETSADASKKSEQKQWKLLQRHHRRGKKIQPLTMTNNISLQVNMP